MTTTITAPSPRQWVPHTVHLREFSMPDGRKLLVDRRIIGFACPVKEAPDKQTIIGFKTMAKACPVVASYENVKSWWFGTTAKEAAA